MPGMPSPTNEQRIFVGVFERATELQTAAKLNPSHPSSVVDQGDNRENLILTHRHIRGSRRMIHLGVQVHGSVKTAWIFRAWFTNQGTYTDNKMKKDMGNIVHHVTQGKKKCRNVNVEGGELYRQLCVVS